MKVSNSAKIMISGGHLTPALAVLSELKKQGFKKIIWVGSKYTQTLSKNLSPEYQILTSRNLTFVNFSAGKFWRRWTLATLFKGIFNLFLIPIGFFRALIILLKYRPDVIVSFGGYLALPLIIFARLLGIKSLTHEQTVVLGLANKIITRFSDKILISWPDSQKFFPKNKTILTGNPLRQEVLNVTTNKYKFPNSLPVIYVTGGNQGANTINWRLLAILPKVLQIANVLHQTGQSTLTNDYAKALQTKKELRKDLQNRYIVVDNVFTSEIGEILHKADLIISRAGANTITEVLALGKLVILIPLPWSSHNEQLKNARMVAATGLGNILEQYDGMPADLLLEKIKLGLNILKSGKDFSGKPLAASQQQAKKLIKTNASSRIVEVIIQLLEKA
ncbi:MAG TPA: UDP-N-acetylglucosamine--N-acetylmuramyl-(pentapeptide) pyrophosphoryl-undecaprenol N-acetylglucosamine transferase [Candidatus Dojkabacteria bacterium]|nr:UDP-N-acetylglucosamine--N-acetylmuramyl-(pentapeptide) pyrophosphoryl-undecaprenol N-acetylglucosamine transferase [Candidatus Dojkabacteria bacterium]